MLGFLRKIAAEALDRKLRIVDKIIPGVIRLTKKIPPMLLA